MISGLWELCKKIVEPYDLPLAVFSPVKPFVGNPPSADGLWGLPEEPKEPKQSKVYQIAQLYVPR